MPLTGKAKHILVELKGHAPFTAFGAVVGIVFMVIFRNADGAKGHLLFTVFHPTHVVLSAIVTASMFKLHATKKHFFIVLIIGYLGSVGIATLSDIIIPHIGTVLLNLDIPTHAKLHQHNHHIYLGFIEQWYIVNPAAALGILLAFYLPRTKLPHAGHVLISTWASSSYLLMNIESQITIAVAVGIFVTLFIAIWLPCCISDIIFPLLFVKSDLEITAPCPEHNLHSHPHIHKNSE